MVDYIFIIGVGSGVDSVVLDSDLSFLVEIAVWFAIKSQVRSRCN